ncbi:MAG: hypothetical protein ACKOEE_05210 [Tagaea sp.]
MLKILSFLAGFALLLVPAAAQASEGHAHGEGAHVDTDVTLKLGVDRNYRSTNARTRYTDAYGEAEAVAKFHFNAAFFVQAKLHWERVKFATENRAFGGHGLYLENLFASLAFDGNSVALGKFNPNFGMGWDDARLPGFYANEFAKDYQTKEAIGAAYGRKADFGALGTHKFDAAFFFFDNTSLSRSALNRPAYGPGQGPLSTTQRLGQNRAIYGGPGNTTAPESFAFQYEIADPAGVAGLVFAAGYRYLAAGDKQPAGLQAGNGPVASRASHGTVAAARYEIGLPAGFVLTPFVEWAKFTDVFNSDPNIGVNQFKDRAYLTTAAILTWRDWTLVASRMTRTFARPDNEAVAGAFFNQEDRQVAANLLYKVWDDLTLGAGYRKTRAVPVFGNVNRQAVTNSFGAQAVYTLEF